VSRGKTPIFDMEGLFGNLLDEEQRLDKREDSRNIYALATTKLNKEIICNYCNKKGHEELNCWTKNPIICGYCGKKGHEELKC